MDHDERIARLEAEASERWGDEWMIETQRFADGDVRAHATRSRGRDKGGNMVEDRLFISEGGKTMVERVTLQRREIDSETIEAPTPSA